MSSAVPIHPLVRLARQASSSLSRFPPTSAPRIGPSRLMSTSARSQYAKPSSRNAARSNGDSNSSGTPQASLSPSTSTSSSSSQAQDDVKSSSPLDSTAHHSYAASSRGKPVSPPPTAAAPVKLTDNRSLQAQKDAKDLKERKEEAKASGKFESSTSASKDEKIDASKVSKGASLHPIAVEKDRRASKAAEQQDKTASSSSTTNIIDGSTGKSASSSTAGAETGKLTEGIFIPHRGGDTGRVPSEANRTPTIDASGTEASSSTSSTTPLRANSSGSNFIPPRSEARARTEDGGSGPPATTQTSELGQMRPVNPLHPFDTHAFIKRLEEAKFVSKRIGTAEAEGDKGGATTETSLSTLRRHDPAEAIMEALRHLLISRGERVVDQHISKTEVDNQAYLFTAALSELRTELQVRARSDAAALRSMVTLLQREVDGLNQKMREDTGAMKHDIQVDMNNRKSEAKEEQNTLEQEIQDLNNRFTISISDLKTEIEQNVKWDATRSALIVVFGCIVILIATLTAADHLTREEVVEDQGSNPQRRVADARSGPDTLIKAATRSAEELGLVENANYDEGDGSRYV